MCHILAKSRVKKQIQETIRFVSFRCFYCDGDTMSIAQSSIKEILFSLIALHFLFAPVNLLIKVVVGILTVFTPMIKLVASKKGMPWTLLSFLWCDFFEPLFRIQVITMGFLALVPVETIAVWGLPIYFALLPVTVWILKRWFTNTCATLCKVLDPVYYHA